jgi:hypothetical protein
MALQLLSLTALSVQYQEEEEAVAEALEEQLVIS